MSEFETKYIIKLKETQELTALNYFIKIDINA